MKKIILISLLVIFSISSSFAQKIRFSDSTNVWKFLSIIEGAGSMSGTTLYTVGYSGSTIINGKKYMTLTLYDFHVYEDTIAKKIYARGASDTTDHLLYDYNLTIGDTLANNITGVLPSWVIATDSTEINGIWYKVWHFEGGNVSTGDIYYYCVIEGIGSLNGLNMPVSQTYQYMYTLGEDNEQARCFQNNGATYPLSNPVHVSCSIPTSAYFFDNTTSCALQADKIVKKDRSVSVSPNPIDPSSKIIFPNHISSGAVAIYNDLGQPVINFPFQNKDELQIGNKIKMPGIYYYRVTDSEHGAVYSGKFLKR